MERRDDIDRWLDQWSWADFSLELRPMAVSKRITRIAQNLEKLATEILTPLGLDSGEFDVLATLLRAGPPHELAPSTLSSSLMLSGGGLTKRLARLESRELITRRLSPDDRRSLLVTLTESGRSLGECAVTAHARATSEMIERLGPENRESLSALLRELLLIQEDSPVSASASQHETGQ